MDKWEQLHQEQQELMRKDETIHDRLRDLNKVLEIADIIHVKSHALLEELAYTFPGYRQNITFGRSYDTLKQQMRRQEDTLSQQIKSDKQEHKKLEESIDILTIEKRRVLMEKKDEY